MVLLAGKKLNRAYGDLLPVKPDRYAERNKLLLEAKKLLAKAIGEDQERYHYPCDPKAALLLGGVALKEENRDKALSWWRPLLDNRSDYPDSEHPIIGETASRLIDLEKEIAAENAAREKEHELFSYLTHTLRNSLSTGPETLRQTQRILKKELKDHPIPPKVLRNIGSLFSTFVFTDSMVTTFKQLVANPETLNHGWEEDQKGSGNIRWLLAVSIRQVLSRLLFSDSFVKAKKQIIHGDTVVVQRSFMDELMSADLTPDSVEPLYHWCEQQLPMVRIELDPSAEQYHFSNDQVKFSILFATFSELLLNAFKYWSGEGVIRVGWQQVEAGYQFTVTNPTTPAAQGSTDSTGKGLIFIEAVLEKLEQTQFEHKLERGHYQSRLTIGITE